MMHDEHTIHLFGEVLFDHFPDGSRILGGAPFNVAWHLQAFGQSPLLISRIGNDAEGREISERMAAWGLRRDALQTDAEHPTGSVRVLIQDGEPHYDIVAGCAYDYIAKAALDKGISRGILYHGSLAIRNPATRAALQTAKERHQGKIFVDVNLRPPWWEPDTLLPLLEDADWVKLNDAELAILCPGYANPEAAMLAFAKQFDLDFLVVTRGAKGAIAYGKQQGLASVTPPKNTTVVDTVGAGDAFAAVLLLGVVREWPLPEILERAQAFAGAIVGRRGATVADRAFYHRFGDCWN